MCAWLVTLANAAAAQDSPQVRPTSAQVYVAGRPIRFDRLGLAFGDPVIPVADSGLRTMLSLVSARSTWQPGQRFAAIARADGKLVTFTIGSDVVSVDGIPTPIPFAPFYKDSDFYVPLLPLGRALGLGVRGFHGGYTFVPQLVSVTRWLEADRTVVAVEGSAPISWRSSFDAQADVLTLSFAGFGNDVPAKVFLGGREATVARMAQRGPPGFPTTTVALSLKKGVRFAAHRRGNGLSMALVLARSVSALRVVDRSPPQVGHVVEAPRPAGPSPVDTQSPIPTSSPMPQTSAPPTSPLPTAQPVPEPTDTATPTESVQPSTSPPAQVEVQDQKITDASIAQTPAGARITLTVSGPVTFEWHRLLEPDNRFWVDVQRAVLVGPARSLEPTPPFIKEIKVSQHSIAPDKTVRVSVTPTGPIEVRLGPVAGSPNQLGIEISSAPPGADEASTGSGTLSMAAEPSPPPTYAPLKRNLVVLDPGHGGKDPGAINPAFGLTESKLALSVTKLLKVKLEREGWRVMLTRDDDNEVGDPDGDDSQELQARCDIANAAGARLFVSVHINSSKRIGPNGTTTYYWHPQDLAFAQAVQAATVAEDRIADDGVKRETLYVVHHTFMPSVLVEVAYLSNPRDAALLQQPAFLDRVASGIARGIMDFSGGAR